MELVHRCFTCWVFRRICVVSPPKRCIASSTTVCSTGSSQAYTNAWQITTEMQCVQQDIPDIHKEPIETLNVLHMHVAPLSCHNRRSAKNCVFLWRQAITLQHCFSAFRQIQQYIAHQGAAIFQHVKTQKFVFCL